MFSELWRDVVKGKSVEATKTVAEIVCSVLARRPPLSGPGGGTLPQSRRYVGMPRRKLAPRARPFLLVKRETTLKSRQLGGTREHLCYSRHASTFETSSS